MYRHIIELKKKTDAELYVFHDSLFWVEMYIYDHIYTDAHIHMCILLRNVWTDAFQNPKRLKEMGMRLREAILFQWMHFYIIWCFILTCTEYEILKFF